MMVTHRKRRHPWCRVTPMRLLAAVVLSTAAVAVSGPPARADVVAYLVNVTVRPGYNFLNADDAIRYGQGICDRVGQGRPFALIISDIKTDFSSADEYQASYLTSQAVNELCPALIWQLRNSAAHYRPSQWGQ
jgi:Protein of unknown function (DUF732)